MAGQQQSMYGATAEINVRRGSSNQCGQGSSNQCAARRTYALRNTQECQYEGCLRKLRFLNNQLSLRSV